MRCFHERYYIVASDQWRAGITFPITCHAHKKSRLPFASFRRSVLGPNGPKSQCAWHSAMRGAFCLNCNCCYFICFIIYFNVCICKYCYFVCFIRVFESLGYHQEKVFRRCSKVLRLSKAVLKLF